MNLIELIKAALKKAGLPEDLHDQIKAEKEDEIDGLVDEFKKSYTPPTKTLADILKDDTLKADLDKYIDDKTQPEIDRRVTQALKTYDEKMKGGGSGGEEDKRFDELKDQITKLTESLTGQQEAQEQQRLKTISNAKLKEAGLPDSWNERVSVKSETEIEGAVKTLIDEFAGIKQGVIDKALKDNPIPGLSFGQSGGVTKGKIDEFVKDMKTEEAGVPVQKL